MRGFVANTDYDWFTHLRAIEPPIDEVNFWKPGSGDELLGTPAGSRIRLPHDIAHRPAVESLIWHNEQRYQG